MCKTNQRTTSSNAVTQWKQSSSNYQLDQRIDYYCEEGRRSKGIRGRLALLTHYLELPNCQFPNVEKVYPFIIIQNGAVLHVSSVEMFGKYIEIFVLKHFMFRQTGVNWTTCSTDSNYATPALVNIFKGNGYSFLADERRKYQQQNDKVENPWKWQKIGYYIHFERMNKCSERFLNGNN